jgi:hypothetical protein
VETGKFLGILGKFFYSGDIGNEEETKGEMTMFSVRQKREIADAVQKILRDTNHPELPKGEIAFSLHVDGAEAWSWADIRNNGAVVVPDVNPHNEAQDTVKA